ncbi:MAG: MazG nucleotide pyrophosphohydrolase domain-containing protein [Acidimicrobiales bacterium]
MAQLKRALWSYRPELHVGRQARDTVRFLAWPPLPLATRPTYGLVFAAAAAMLPGSPAGRCGFLCCPWPSPRHPTGGHGADAHTRLGPRRPDPRPIGSTAMDLAELQQLMATLYGEADRERGVPATVAWLCEELGELAQAVRKGTVDDQLHEFGDVLAWLASLAHQLGISLDEAMQRYVTDPP